MVLQIFKRALIDMMWCYVYSLMMVYFSRYPAAGYCHIFISNDRVYNETADERKLTQMNKGGRWSYLDERR